jgi:hypothetical protein
MLTKDKCLTGLREVSRDPENRTMTIGGAAALLV